MYKSYTSFNSHTSQNYVEIETHVSYVFIDNNILFMRIHHVNIIGVIILLMVVLCAR